MIDRDRVQQVIGLLKQSSAMELAVREGASFIRVRRTPPPAPVVAGSGPGEVTPATGASAPATAPTGDCVVRARLVGRLYHGKGAGQPPIVKIGDRVAHDQVIATIEALGKLTGVPAPAAGIVIEFLTEDGTPVQYGAPLIRLKPAPGD